ncbi:MAG: 50S ribosomal protein L9 [Candidatus Thiosymbion ectosymbiont of Robbea hypermnestra]|nr:50S ribosomal protein L9 [Candidatus Thiosymbion ectosymbiont of Robbea hypermnestra]
MEVILLKKVGHLGDLGEKVPVRAGYGRNYLIPSGLAVPATEANLKAFEERRVELERAAMESLIAAESRREMLDSLTVTIARKAGDEGKLFGSVGTQDIVAAVRDMGITLERQEVRLPEGAFRTTGEYEVVLHLHADVDATIRLRVVPEK